MTVEDDRDDSVEDGKRWNRGKKQALGSTADEKRSFTLASQPTRAGKEAPAEARTLQYTCLVPTGGVWRRLCIWN